MLFDPGPWLDTVRRDVTEVLLVEHVGDAIVGCGFEAGVDPQGRQAECRALSIHLLDNRFLQIRGRTIRFGHIRDAPARDFNMIRAENAFKIGGQRGHIRLLRRLRKKRSVRGQCEHDRKRGETLLGHHVGPFWTIVPSCNSTERLEISIAKMLACANRWSC